MKGLQEFDVYLDPLGNEFNLHDAEVFFIMSGTGHGMPPIEYITERGPLQHGESLIDYRLRPRLITMVTRRRFPCRQDYWDGRDDLLDALRPNRQAIGQFNPGVLRKILPDGSMRDIKVMIESGPAFEPRALDKWDELAFTEILRFVAHDPIFFDPMTLVAQGVLTVEDNLIFYDPTDYTVGPNEILTPSFEVDTDADGLADNWTKILAGTVCAMESTIVLNGCKSQEITTDAAGEGIRGPTLVAPAGTTQAVAYAWICRPAAGSDIEVALYDVTAGWVARDIKLLSAGGWQTKVIGGNTWYRIVVSSNAIVAGNTHCLQICAIALTATVFYVDMTFLKWGTIICPDEWIDCGILGGTTHLDRLVFPIWFTGVVISAYLNLVYVGTWFSYPTIVIRGPASNPLVRNVTTDEKLELAYTIAAGEVVTFVTEYGNKTVTNQWGDNLLPYLTTDSDLATFHLEPDPGAPGGVNQMYVFGAFVTPATQVALYWTRRFIGI